MRCREYAKAYLEAFRKYKSQGWKAKLEVVSFRMTIIFSLGWSKYH